MRVKAAQANEWKWIGRTGGKIKEKPGRRGKRGRGIEMKPKAKQAEIMATN